MFNGKTAELMSNMSEYVYDMPQDTTTAGTKTIHVDGVGSYFNSLDMSYLIVDADIANCSVELGTAYDNEGPTSVKVWSP